MNFSQEELTKFKRRPVAILTTGTHLRSSEKEHKVNALALGAEEGRDKLRKAAVRSKYPSTRRFPNEGTHMW